MSAAISAYTQGSPPQPFLPESGPNIGCRQRISASGGSVASISCLACAFTESMSATRVPESSARGSERSTLGLGLGPGLGLGSGSAPEGWGVRVRSPGQE